MKEALVGSVWLGCVALTLLDLPQWLGVNVSQATLSRCPCDLL